MDRLKALMLESEKNSSQIAKDRVEVIGLTIASCLNRASIFLNTDLSMLDYEILERGNKTFLQTIPYRIQVSLLPAESRYADLEEFSIKLGVGDRMLDDDLEQFATPRHLDGHLLVRNYRTGVFLSVHPPLGDGKPVELDEALIRIQQSGIANFDQNRVTEVVREQRALLVKIGNYIPQPESDQLPHSQPGSSA